MCAPMVDMPAGYNFLKLVKSKVTNNCKRYWNYTYLCVVKQIKLNKNKMSTIKGNKPGYSVNHQHDYSTVKTSFGNYTGSWGGEKVSGQLCSIKVNLLIFTHKLY